jgi:DNA-binding NtrC family response regulator
LVTMAALVLEEDATLRAELAEALRRRSYDVIEASASSDVPSVRSRRSFELAVLDVSHPDRRGYAKQLASISPIPILIVLSSNASAREAFEIARMGARAYLPKPFALSAFECTLDEVHEAPPSVGRNAAANVGHRGLHDVQLEVRRSMLRQALAMACGNKTEAARMLRLTRQAIQAMLRDMGRP